LIEISDIATIIGTYAALNQFTFPIVDTVSSVVSHHKKSRIKVSKEEIEKYTGLSDDSTALDYLMLANKIIFEKGTGKGNCKDFPLTTFEVYNQLIRQNNKSELKKMIRLTSSPLMDDTCSGHNWIQYKDGAVWKHYEPTENSSKTMVEEKMSIKEYAD